jgi:TonB-dependent receptor
MKSLIHELARSTLLASASIAVLASGQSFAQTTEAAEDEVSVQDVVIVTGVRGSIIDSIDQKREAAGFVDAISAEDLGRFPDLNISEALQRVPGVTLFRNNTGDGQSINLRGLGPEYTRVQINGLTGTNNGTSGRFGGDFGSVGGGFNFEILASELFDNVAVKKTPAAGDAEGGLAGILELTTPQAFDRKGFNLSASAQAQISETADATTPRLALVMSQNWDDRLGVTASIAYSDASFKSDSNGGISARALTAAATAGLRASATPAQLAALVPQTINYQVDVEDRQTLGLTGGLQFRPNALLEFTLDGIYAEIDSERFFTRADAPPESGILSISDDTIVDGVLTSGTLGTIQQRIAANDLSGTEKFNQISAKVDITPNDNWQITPMIGYSQRKTDRTGQLLSFARGDTATGLPARFPVSYQINGPFIEFSTPGTDYSAASNPDEFFINVFLIRPTKDKDEELSAKLDFSRFFSDSALTRVNFGARVSSREIDRSSFEARIQSATATTDLRTLPTLGDALVVNSFDINGAPASFPNTVITADPRRILSLYLPNGYDFSSQFTPITGPLTNINIDGAAINGAVLRILQANAATRTFNGGEDTVALYADATFELEKLLVNAGLRYVDTKQSSSGYSVGNNISTPTTVENDYQKFLPSITARYNLGDDLIVRGAYSRTLSRPTLFDLRVAETYSGIDASGGSGSAGNPALQPYTSDNLDIGVEWYFAEEGLIAVNAFHKSIDGLIVSGTVTENRTFESQVTRQEVTAPIIFRVPVNGEESTINGVEFLAQSRFNFLPGPLSNMGGIFNYTLASSDAAFEEGDNAAISNGLPGLSKNSFNAIAYYDDGKLDARLSYAWRERFTQSLAGSFGVPEFQQDYGQLDLSANYAITDKLTLQFQALNLTNERLEIVSVQDIPNTTTQLDRRWFVGARYQF